MMGWFNSMAKKICHTGEINKHPLKKFSQKFYFHYLLLLFSALSPSFCPSVCPSLHLSFCPSLTFFLSPPNLPCFIFPSSFPPSFIFSFFLPSLFLLSPSFSFSFWGCGPSIFDYGAHWDLHILSYVVCIYALSKVEA